MSMSGHPSYFLRATAATAVARLSHRNSVRPSDTRVDQSKTVQARISKFSPSAALVLGNVNLLHKFEGVTGTKSLNERGVGKICDIQPIWRWQSDMWRFLVSTSKTL